MSDYITNLSCFPVMPDILSFNLLQYLKFLNPEVQWVVDRMKEGKLVGTDGMNNNLT